MTAPAASRTLGDLLAEEIAFWRLRCRLGCVEEAQGLAGYRHAVGRYWQRTASLPDEGRLNAAELRLLAAGVPEGAKPLPRLPATGPLAPEWIFSALQLARFSNLTAEGLAARLALYGAGVLRAEDTVAEGGFLPVLKPSFDDEGAAA
ncbi:MAG: hypothetical protein L6R43_08815 [Planctomycetes bacterium]|nr:hypothetical protein [Planctomycetota bacterium]